MSSSFNNNNNNLNLSYGIMQTQPVNKVQNLVRYELLLLIVWFFVEMGRWYAVRDIRRGSEDEDGENRAKFLSKRFHRISMFVLIGAAVGVFIYWLIVDVGFPQAFYSPLKTASVALPGDSYNMNISHTTLIKPQSQTNSNTAAGGFYHNTAAIANIPIINKPVKSRRYSPISD